nr:LPXTG cell wall anchor domain-containing protein [Bacillus sp. AFS014408]
MDSAQSQKELPKTGQRTPLEPYMGAVLVMMSFGLLVLGKKRQQ